MRGASACTRGSRSASRARSASRNAARPGWREPGLWSVALVNGGIAAARLLGIGLTGEFTGFFAGALVWEIGFTVAALLALRGRKA